MSNPSIGDTPIVPTARKISGKTLELDIDISKSDVGLANVDNTSDMGKPVSTAQNTAILAKMNTPSGNTNQYMRGDGTLASFPSIPSAQVNSDWSASSGVAQIANKPTLYTAPYSCYQSLINQSGTNAPSGSTLANDFGTTTFTWARSSTGVYTITANASVFTSGKTGVVISNPNNPLANFRYAVTSTTVITITTSVLSVLSLILTSGNTDGLLSNTLFEIRVYP